MGKLKVSANVDLSSATIGGCLKQIRRSNVALPPDHVPATINVWVCDIQPQHTKSVVRFIEKHMKPVDETDFVHVKRFRKNTNAETGAVSISAILCPATTFTHSELLSSLHTHFDPGFAGANLHVSQIPAELPPTKELSVKWSTEIWPLSWKGNPNHQDLITAYFDVDEESTLIKRLLAHVHESLGSETVPVVTMIAKQDPESKKIDMLHFSRDSRHQHVLQHSVMNAIAEVARKERERRAKHDKNGEKSEEGYLCHNLLVYTSHEPCTMCAMALVHSRIGRLIYVKKHPLGAIESSHYIGDRRDLNWTFDIWRWVGSGEEFPGVPDSVAP
ncbi:hypothetical protein OXX69_003292 [Metschnikowia pulcherrima]